MSAPPRARRVGIIGAGRVGCALGAALADAGYEIVGITARPSGGPSEHAAVLPGVPVRPAAEIVTAAELVLIAVPDDRLGPVVAELAGWLPTRSPGRPPVMAHTSGAQGVTVLAPVVARGAWPLALHPAMTFTGRPDDLDRLRKGIAFGVTAPPPVRPFAEGLVADLGGTPEWVPENRRPLYHAALAHGTNHLVTLVNDALDLLRSAGVADPVRVLDPMLHAALDNVLRLGDAALTGPVSRGDAGTVARHLDALADTDPGTLPGYRELARRTTGRAVASGRLTGRQADRVRRALEPPGADSADVPQPAGVPQLAGVPDVAGVPASAGAAEVDGEEEC